MNRNPNGPAQPSNLIRDEDGDEIYVQPRLYVNYCEKAAALVYPFLIIVLIAAMLSSIFVVCKEGCHPFT